MNSPTQLSPEEEIAFLLGKVMTQALRDLYRAFDGDISMALILGELGEYAAALRHTPLQKNRRQHLRTSNAHSIAAASGMPRETVRRKLNKLMAKGWIIEMPNGNLGLNPQHEPPLTTLFADYNRRLLEAMRDAVKKLEHLENH